MSPSEQLIALEKSALGIRRKFHINAEERFDFSNIKEVLPQITLVNCPFTNEVDGLTFKLNTDKSIIAINSNKTVGDYNFALAHELYHHYYSEQGALISRAINFNADLNKSEENKANFFAMFLLLPLAAVEKFVSESCEGIINEKTIVRMCDYFRVSIRPVLVRLYLSCYIDKDEFDRLKVLHYDNFIDRSNPNSAFFMCDGKYKVDGYYHEIANKLFAEDKITESKLKEILRVTSGD